ncbi:MAG: hypothetical protein KAS93_06120 [Gammaproteobacteria bacterium]|nr:hypothetical protein [Gammaproteobacteria bacterium]
MMEKNIKDKLIILAERLNTVCDDISPIFIEEQANRKKEQHVMPSRHTMDLTSLVLGKPKIQNIELTAALNGENNFKFQQYAQVINTYLTKLEDIQFLKDHGLKLQLTDQPTQENIEIIFFDNRLKEIEKALAKGRSDLPKRMQESPEDDQPKLQDPPTRRATEPNPDKDPAPEASETSSKHSSKHAESAPEPALEPTPPSSTSSFRKGSSHEISVADNGSDTSSATTKDGRPPQPQIIDVQTVWYELDLTNKKARLITHHPDNAVKTEDLGDVKISKKQITIFYARSGNKKSLEELRFDKDEYVTKGFKPAQNETATAAFPFTLAPLHNESAAINDEIEKLKQNKKTARKHSDKPTRKAALKEIKSDFQHLKIAQKDMKKIEKIKKHNNGKIKIVGMGYTHPAKLALITSPIGVAITSGFAVGALGAMMLITGGYTAAAVPIGTAIMAVVGACIAVPVTLISGYAARFHPLAVNKMLTPVTLPATAAKKGAELTIKATNKSAHAVAHGVASTTAAIKNCLIKATPEDGERQLLLPEGPDKSSLHEAMSSRRNDVSQTTSIQSGEAPLLDPEPDDGASLPDEPTLSETSLNAFFSPKKTDGSQSGESLSTEEKLDLLLSPLTPSSENQAIRTAVKPSPNS